MRPRASILGAMKCSVVFSRIPKCLQRGRRRCGGVAAFVNGRFTEKRGFYANHSGRASILAFLFSFFVVPSSGGQDTRVPIRAG